ncbi:MAG: hypothetical protein QG670_1642 [Thermoproteota archaeon]|nr:hypothetical protein [Thermoproteota archaeon]
MDENELLIKIYIGQNIRNEGVLESTFSISADEHNNLVNKKLIWVNHWYSHYLYLTTSNGSEISRSLINKRIEFNKEKIKDFLATFSPRLVGFLINDYLAKSLDFPENMPEYISESWLDPWKAIILKDARIWSKRTDILSKLEELGLCIRTKNYVSTRGGELRESRYVIPPEIRKLLLEITPSYGLTEEENRNCRLNYFLVENVFWWLDWPSIEETRKRYIDEMQRLNINESDVKAVIDKLTKEGITDQYNGITVTNVEPFIIKDRISYQFSLKNLLIEPIVTNLLEGKPKIGDEKVESEQSQILQRVIRLVEAKYTLTQNAGIFGIDLFDSTPDIEVCITRMLKVPTTDGEQKEFIEILYNYIIDRSKGWLLKIGDLKSGETSSIEERIIKKGRSIPPEFEAEFEKAIQDLRLLNNLRNKLSHSKAARDWEEIGNIYRKLINKPLPNSKKDYVKVQESLLEIITQSLESLFQIFMKLND